MNIKPLAITLLTLSLTACFGGPQALREEPAGVHSFEFAGAPAEVARRIHVQATKCYGGGFYAPSGVQTAETRAGLSIDEAAGTASIDVTQYGVLGPQTWLLMDLRESAPGRTRVDVSYSRSGYLRRAQAVERWLTERYERCR